MLSFASDENFNNDIVRGLLRRMPNMDIVRVQDVGLSGADDPDILEWAANERRIMLTHDSMTMIDYAYDRVREGKPMPGVIEVPDDVPIGSAIDDLLLFVEVSRGDEWEGRVVYLPLR